MSKARKHSERTKDKISKGLRKFHGTKHTEPSARKLAAIAHAKRMIIQPNVALYSYHAGNRSLPR